MLLLLALFAISCNSAAVEEKKMDEKIVNLIAEDVHKEQGWKTEDVRVDEVDRLKHGSCLFYTAGHKVRPLSYQLNYAVIGGATLVSLADNQAPGKILKACGSDAPPAWWAEIVTRFHQDLGGGVVLADANQNPGATRKIEAAKKEFATPKFEDSPAGKTVSYYLLEPESFQIFSIRATIAKDGSVKVERASL